MARPARSAALPAHDLHTHTVHCGHASDDATVANLAARAAEVGLATLGVSEHVIFPGDAGRVAQVRADLGALGADHATVRMMVGVEIDPDPIALDGTWVADPGPAEYAILSPHRVPEYGVGHWAFRDLSLAEREVRRLGAVWLDWYAACIERGGFQILGHPLREPIRLGLLTLDDSRVFGRALEILAAAASRGIAFEVNNGWAADLRSRGELGRYAELVREARSRGMRFCVGSDAHACGEIGDYDEVLALAHAAGIGADDWVDAAALMGGQATRTGRSLVSGS